MTTIIKIPLYVEIETEDGLDRKVIARSVQSNFIPEFYSVIQTNISLISYFSSSSLRFIKQDLGNDIRFRFIQNSDLFRKADPIKGF